MEITDKDVQSKAVYASAFPCVSACLSIRLGNVLVFAIVFTVRPHDQMQIRFALQRRA